MNLQTPGPLECVPEKGRGLCSGRGFVLWSRDGYVIAERRPETCDSPHEPMEVNAALLTASYNAFDKAGRELGMDATELARTIDVAAMVRVLRMINDNDIDLSRAIMAAEMIRLPKEAE